MVVCHQPVYNKESKLPMESESERIKASVYSTYSIIRDFILGVDHTTVCESRSAEQVFFPFFPPLFVCLSDEESRDPSR